MSNYYNPKMGQPIPIQDAIIDSALLKGRLVVMQDLSGQRVSPHQMVTGIESLSYMHSWGKFDPKFPKVFFTILPNTKNKGMLISINAQSYPNLDLLEQHLRDLRLDCIEYGRWAFVVCNCEYPQTEHQADIVLKFDRSQAEQVIVVKNRLSGVSYV